MTLIHNPVPSPPTTEEQEVRPPSPNIILRRDNDFLNSQKSAWDSSSDAEGEAEVQKVPDVHRDDLASRRAPRVPSTPKVHQFVPSPTCTNKDRERWEGIRRASQLTLQERDTRSDVCEYVQVIPPFESLLTDLVFSRCLSLCVVVTCAVHFTLIRNACISGSVIGQREGTSP